VETALINKNKDQPISNNPVWPSTEQLLARAPTLRPVHFLSYHLTVALTL
jgi:hypothetical protein